MGANKSNSKSSKSPTSDKTPPLAVASVPSEDVPTDPNNSIFDAAFEDVTNILGEKLAKIGVEHSILIAINPETGHPICVTNGHLYNIGCAANEIMANINQKLLDDLGLGARRTEHQ